MSTDILSLLGRFDEEMKKSIYHPAYEAMIRHLRDRRLHLGLTQEDVERKLKVSHGWLCKAEKCERRLDFLETLDLCRVYGIDPVELAKIMEKRPLGRFSLPSGGGFRVGRRSVPNSASGDRT